MKTRVHFDPALTFPFSVEYFCENINEWKFLSWQPSREDAEKEALKFSEKDFKEVFNYTYFKNGQKTECENLQ